MEKEKFKDVITYVLIIGLFILAFLVIRPIFYSIIFGILLAYIFYPLYLWLLRKTKGTNTSAFIVCFCILILTLALSGVILGSLLKQIIDFSIYLKGVSFIDVVNKILPDFIASAETSTTLVNSIKSSLSTLLEEFITNLGNFILNTPALLLQLLVIFLILFFALRDGKEAFDYFKSLAPFDKEIQERFFKHFKDITQSVLVGQVVVGILQGLIAGIGYFVFGVPNALLLTILTVIIGIIPIIGPWLVWIPVDIYLFTVGKTWAAVGLLIYGLFLINWIDTIVRPMIVSRKTQINQGIVLIGMIGGLFVFGILGLILGPLILAYVLLVIEIYQKQKLGENIVFQKPYRPKTRFSTFKIIDQFQKTLGE